MIADERKFEFIALVEDLIRDLDSGIKYYEIYPTSHPLVTQVTDKIHFCLIKILRDFERDLQFVNLSVLGHNLYANRIALPETYKTNLFRKFRETVLQKNVRNFTFINGLDKPDVIKFLTIMALTPEDRLAQGGLAKLFVEQRVMYIKVDGLQLGGSTTEDDHLLVQFFTNQLVGDDRTAFKTLLLQLLKTQAKRVADVISTVTAFYQNPDFYEEGLSKPERAARMAVVMIHDLLEEVFPGDSLNEYVFSIAEAIRHLDPVVLGFIGRICVYSDRTTQEIIDSDGKVQVSDSELVTGIIDRYDFLRVLHSGHVQIEKIITELKCEFGSLTDSRDSTKLDSLFSSLLEHLEFLKDRYKIVRPEVESIMTLLVNLRDYDKALALLEGLAKIFQEKYEVEDTADELLATLRKASQSLLATPVLATTLRIGDIYIETVSRAQLTAKHYAVLRDILIGAHKSVMPALTVSELEQLRDHWLSIVETRLHDARSVYLAVDLLIEVGKAFNNQMSWGNAIALGDSLQALSQRQDIALTVRDALMTAKHGMADAEIFHTLFEQMVEEKMRARLEAISKLSEAGPQVLEIVNQKMQANVWYIRRNALLVAESLAGASELPSISNLISDSAWQVRKEAIRVATVVAQRIAEQPYDLPLELRRSLLSCLTDENSFVQLEAIRSVAALQIPGSSASLLTLFESLAPTLNINDYSLAQELFTAMATVAHNFPSEQIGIIDALSGFALRKESLFAKTKTKEVKELAVSALATLKTSKARAALQLLADKAKGDIKELAGKLLKDFTVEE